MLLVHKNRFSTSNATNIGLKNIFKLSQKIIRTVILGLKDFVEIIILNTLKQQS